VTTTTAQSHTLAARTAAEFVGTMFLLMTVVGSGIMAVRLTEDAGLQLLQNAIATGLILLALIATFGPISGAHFNPVVTLGFRWQGDIDTPIASIFITAQLAGALVGTVLANLMFQVDAIAAATTNRTGSHLLLAEVIATLGLLLMIFGPVRNRDPGVVPFTVGAYIAGAYYFTSSTSFANPAVTIGRTITDTFAGIAPGSAPAFVAAQLVGLLVAIGVIAFIFRRD